MPWSPTHDEYLERQVLRKSHYPYYVTMTDKFMSGWGQAEGRTAKYIAGANSYEEAQIVAANAKARGDQKNVNIVTRKPSYPAGRFRVGFMDRKGAKRWYERGGFGESTGVLE